MSKPPQPRAKKRQQLNVHLISEATGSLARHMVTVALTQFPRVDYELREHVFCRSASDLREAGTQIQQDEDPIVFSALTRLQLKRSLSRWCDKHSIQHFDLMESVVDYLSLQTGQPPKRDATQAHRCDDQYFRRIDAWEFTLQHDDSRRLESIGEADVILMGLSRVGKTPLAAYMGSLGYRVANVSLSPQVPVPREVEPYRDKTVGLTVEPQKLAATRKRRFDLNGFHDAMRRTDSNSDRYCSPKAAMQETMFAEDVFRKLGVRSLDVTDFTVEESAVRILRLLGLEER